jgi:hypothetical protein
MLLLCIREVTGSILGSESGFADFFVDFLSLSRQIPGLNKERTASFLILSYSLFINHQSSEAKLLTASLNKSQINNIRIISFLLSFCAACSCLFVLLRLFLTNEQDVASFPCSRTRKGKSRLTRRQM